ARRAAAAPGLPLRGAAPSVAGPGRAVALLRGAGVFAVVRLSEGGTVGRGLLRRSGRRLRGCRLVEAGPGGAVALLRGAGVFAVVRLSEGGTVGRGLLRRSGRRLRGSRFAVGRPAAGARRRTRRGAGLTVGGPPISGPGGGLAGGAG